MAAPVRISPPHPVANGPQAVRLWRSDGTPEAAPSPQARRSQSQAGARPRASGGESGFAATLGAKTHAAASPLAQAGKPVTKPSGDTNAAPDGTDRVGIGEELPDADTGSTQAGVEAARAGTVQTETVVVTAEVPATSVFTAGEIADLPDDDAPPSASESRHPTPSKAAADDIAAILATSLPMPSIENAGVVGDDRPDGLSGLRQGGLGSIDRGDSITQAAAGLTVSLDSTAPHSKDGSQPLDASPAGAVSDAGMPADRLEQLLAEPLVRLVSSSQREMVIRLRPPELGDLTVRVAVSGRSVSAWFETPQPQVQQIIGQAIAQLHGDLGTAGYDLTGAWVGTGASGGDARQPVAMPLPARIGDGRAERGRDLSGGRAVIQSASGVSIYV